MEQLSASNSTDLQQRAYELQALLGLDAHAVASIMPADASCQDIEVIHQNSILLYLSNTVYCIIFLVSLLLSVSRCISKPKIIVICLFALSHCLSDRKFVLVCLFAILGSMLFPNFCCHVILVIFCLKIVVCACSAHTSA